MARSRLRRAGALDQAASLGVEARSRHRSSRDRGNGRGWSGDELRRDVLRAAAADADGSLGQALQAESADLVEARDAAWRVLEQVARQRDPAARVALAKDLLPAKGATSEERSQLAASLRAAASLLRDAGLLAAGADRRGLANGDRESAIERRSHSGDAQRSVTAHAAVGRALAALDRNASPKVVADWLVLQPDTPYIANPSGNGNDAWVLGLRTEMAF